jgi:hypothetical protein
MTFKGMDLQWPSETSIWPIQILFWKLVGVNIWNSKQIPTPKKSSPRKQKFYHATPRFEILHQYRCYFAHSLDWTFRTIITRKLLQNYAPVNTLVGYKLTFWWLPRGWGYHLKLRFEILHQWRCYFVHLLEWSLWTLNAYELLKSRAPNNSLAGYKFTFDDFKRDG